MMRRGVLRVELDDLAERRLCLYVLSHEEFVSREAIAYGDVQGIDQGGAT